MWIEKITYQEVSLQGYSKFVMHIDTMQEAGAYCEGVQVQGQSEKAH